MSVYSVNPTRTCSVEGCERSYWARGLCRNHHSRQWRRSRQHEIRPVQWVRNMPCDIDEIVVERLVGGQWVDCTAWERRAAVVELHRRGLSKWDIARRLRMHHRQVYRDLAYSEQVSA